MRTCTYNLSALHKAMTPVEHGYYDVVEHFEVGDYFHHRVYGGEFVLSMIMECEEYSGTDGPFGSRRGISLLLDTQLDEEYNRCDSMCFPLGSIVYIIPKQNMEGFLQSRPDLKETYCIRGFANITDPIWNTVGRPLGFGAESPKAQ